MSVVLYKPVSGPVSKLEEELVEREIPFSVMHDLSNVELFPALEVDGQILDYKEAKEWLKNWKV